MRMVVAREEEKPRLTGDAAIRVRPHLLDRHIDQLLHIVVNDLILAPYEVKACVQYFVSCVNVS